MQLNSKSKQALVLEVDEMCNVFRPVSKYVLQLEMRQDFCLCPSTQTKVWAHSRRAETWDSLIARSLSVSWWSRSHTALTLCMDFAGLRSAVFRPHPAVPWAERLSPWQRSSPAIVRCYSLERCRAVHAKHTVVHAFVCPIVTLNKSSTDQQNTDRLTVLFSFVFRLIGFPSRRDFVT